MGSIPRSSYFDRKNQKGRAFTQQIQPGQSSGEVKFGSVERAPTSAKKVATEALSVDRFTLNSPIEPGEPTEGDQGDIPNPLRASAGISAEMKSNLKQAYKEKGAAAPILNSAKGFFAKKQVNDMKQEAEVKHMASIFKVEAAESGLGHSSFLRLTLRANFAE